MLDDIDRQLLSTLQENGRTPNATLAREVGMAPSAVLERIRKLETKGVIEGYEARLSARSLGLELLAFVFVKSNEAISGARTGEALAAIPEVQEVHHVAGEDCYLVKVRSESPEALGRLLRTAFGSIPSVVSTRSTIVLQTLKECGRLSLPPAAASE